MTNDNTQRFDIFLTGAAQPGIEPPLVAARLAELFRIPPERAALLLGGKPQRVKAGVDRATALRYRDALRQAGAGFAIREAAGAAPPSEVTPAQHADRPAPSARAIPALPVALPVSLSVAPVGADVLAPEERAQVDAAEIDTSALAVAPLSAAEERPAPLTPPAPDTSHLTMRAEGSDLLDPAERRADVAPVAAPALSLAEPGARLETLSDERPPLAPLIDHLDMAPAGEMLLAENERPTPPPPFEPHESRQWQLKPV